MFLKKLLPIVLFIAFSQTTYCQVSFNYGPELGVTIPHLPALQNSNPQGEEISETYFPIISPLIGFQSQATFCEHLQLTAGLQYQITGTNFHSHSDGSDIRDDGSGTYYTYTYDMWEKQRFHKITLPVTVGYKFTIGRFTPTIYTGLRPNLYVTGTYAYNTEYVATDNAEPGASENEFNPLSKLEARTPMAHCQYQITSGLSTEIGPRIKIAINYSRGPEIYYAEKSTSKESDYISMINQDFSISLTYLLADIVKVAK